MRIIKTKKEWNDTLDVNFPFSDIYFRYEYLHLFEKHFDALQECIFWEDSYVKIFWPHLIRNVHIYGNKNLKDLTSPYGYGGPLISVKTDQDSETYNSNEYANVNINTKNSIIQFFKEYKLYAKENNFLCEFIRFHPLFDAHNYLNSLFEVSYLSDVVVIDLKTDINQIWSNCSKNTRRYVRKSDKEFQNIIITDKPSSKDLSSFLTLYYQTMERQGASDKYFFDKGFIKDHFDLLKSYLVYCKNELDEIGSAAIFLKSEEIINYHLGATNYNFKFSPLRLILWKSIEVGQKNGFKFLNLGGGLKPNDSLYRFKKGFSGMHKKFCIGKLLFEKNHYENVLKLSKISNGSNYFPAYRKFDNSII